MSYRLRRLNFVNEQHESALLKLSLSVTRIGRHSESNLCLISKEHPCLTSRLHAEIHCISDNENDAKYLLRDTSLNGTYVNDRRIIDYHLLTEGDIITFGHYGGHVIKKGELAPNKQAEFQFVFEKSTSMVSRPEVQNRSIAIPPAWQKFSDITDEDLSQVISTSINRVTQFTQSDSEGSANLECDHSVDRTACFCNNNGVTKLPNGDHWKWVATTECAARTTTSGKLPVNASPGNGVDFSMSAILSDISSKIKVGGKPCTQNHEDSSYITPLHVQSSSGLHHYVSDASLSDFLRPAGKSSKTTSDSFNCVEIMKSTARSPMFDFSKSLDPENGGVMMRRHSVPKVRDVTAASTNSATSSAGKKRKGTSNKSKCKRSMNSRSNDRLQFHSSNDKCAAIDCIKPKSNKVLWVQCDDCDAWYHTACAGCTSSANQLALAQFHCGCV